MTTRSTIPWTLRCCWFIQDATFGIQKIWWRIWNAGIKRRWYKLVPAKNEFHPSYDLDVRALIALSPKYAEAYRSRLLRRRIQAHAREPF